MGRGTQAQFFANASFDTRRQMRAGADGAGEFADGYRVFNAEEPDPSAAEFVVHQRELEAKGGRFAVNPMAAPMQGVNLCSFARRAMTGSNCFTSAMRRSAD